MFKKTSSIFVFMLVFAISSCGYKTVDSEKSKDHGKQPWIVDIEDLTLKNENFRTTHWTGKNLQMTTMTIQPGGEIGLEQHEKGDQFIRVEEGDGRVVMGESKDKLSFDKKVSDDWAIFVPEGFWHNIINEGEKPLKVYVIYSPPEHPAGTEHKSFEEAQSAH